MTMVKIWIDTKLKYKIIKGGKNDNGKNLD